MIKVVVDASVLINLLHLDRLDVVGALIGYEFLVPDEVGGEVQEPQQRERLSVGRTAGYIHAITFSGPLELALFAELRSTLGRGEAACLALAQSRGHSVACDERGVFLREARSRLGIDRILNTPGVLLLAIRQGSLTVLEADDAKALLETRKFRMNFRSFSELVSSGRCSEEN